MKGLPAMPVNILSQWSVSVDAVTVVYRPSIEAQQLQAWFRNEHTQQSRDRGYKRRAFKLWGYEGYVIGHVAEGVDRHGNVLYAGKNEGVSALWATGYLLAGRCTRLDLALDVIVSPGEEDKTIEDEIAPVSAMQKAMGEAGKKMRYISGMGDGDTLELGRRANDDYTRVYNKWAERGKDDYYAGIVRYETEFKGLSATELFEVIKQTADSARVANYYLSMLVSWGFTGPSYLAFENVERARMKRDVPDDEKTRRWLHTQVRPAVERLVKLYGEDAILGDLGVSRETPGDLFGTIDDRALRGKIVKRA